ncbi:MAG: shikimate kinase [Oscillospiraceae bacterium]|nr:shikimate kinase [Oscillospiraceae bacterium]
MKFLILIGNAAVGKMTVGQALVNITDFKLFHGHMILEPVLEIYGERNMAIEHQIRDIIFADFAQSNNYGLIFTYMMDFSKDSSCWDYLEHICSFFKQHNADIYFVELVASQQVRLQRNVMPSRLQAKPSKRNTERTTKAIYETDKAYQVTSTDGEIPWSNYLKIDNSDLAPDVVAGMIKNTFSL